MNLRRLAPWRVTRRGFLTIAGTAGVVQAAARLAGPAAARPPLPRLPDTAAQGAAVPTEPVPSAAAYRFFNAAEASCIEALCERLIPEDAASPGALAAGVPRHLDSELAGDWGGGERAYRLGVWQPGTLLHDYRAPATPRDLFRNALAAIDGYFERRGTTFSRATQETQHAYLRTLEAGLASWGDAHAAVFFDLLVKMTLEGYFADPVRCARRDTLAWKMLGFPGACAHAAVSA